MIFCVICANILYFLRLTDKLLELFSQYQIFRINIIEHYAMLLEVILLLYVIKLSVSNDNQNFYNMYFSNVSAINMLFCIY